MSILQALTSNTVLEAAQALADHAVSVVPVTGKKCVIGWKRWQSEVASMSKIYDWHHTGMLRGIGVVCGSISGNLAVMDLDGYEAVQRYHRQFPHLANTLIVRSGSGKGQHLYYYTAKNMPTTRAKGFELRSDGSYVVAPPSRHPSGGQYTVIRNLEPLFLPDLDEVANWIRTMKKSTVTPMKPQKPVVSGKNDAWVRAVVNRELDGLRRCGTDVNNKLNAVAYRLARICANPDSGLSPSAIRSQIYDAAIHLSQRDGSRATLKTLDSGWNAGYKNPCAIPRAK